MAGNTAQTQLPQTWVKCCTSTGTCARKQVTTTSKRYFRCRRELFGVNVWVQSANPERARAHAQDQVRLLCNQLRAMRVRRTSIADLRTAGKYCDLAELWLYIDQQVAAIDLTVHTPDNARRVHDALMLLLCLREHPVARPDCMRWLLTPGAAQPCAQCSVPGCPGNAWNGNVATFVHFKTAASHGEHRIEVKAGSKTALFSEAYQTWARALLLKEDTNYMFLTTKGRAFKTAGSWALYLPRLLSSCAQLTWTKVSNTPAPHACWLRSRAATATPHCRLGRGAKRDAGGAGR